jgi:hypothetical protein
MVEAATNRLPVALLPKGALPLWPSLRSLLPRKRGGNSSPAPPAGLSLGGDSLSTLELGSRITEAAHEIKVGP